MSSAPQAGEGDVLSVPRIAQTLIKLRRHDDAMRAARTPLELRVGHGIEGDCHTSPTGPRQLLLCEGEALIDVGVSAETMRANILTLGLDLHALPSGTVLEVGSARVRLTHRCESCRHLRSYLPTQQAFRRLVSRRGVLAVVERDGQVTVGDDVVVSDTPAYPAVPDGVFERVCWIIQRVPEGHVLSYRDLLDAAGLQRTYSRVLPTYLRRAQTLRLPVHRIVTTAGDLNGHINGQLERLHGEGIEPWTAPHWDTSGLYLAR